MPDTVSLSTLAGGALAERFEDALQQVLDNIQDVNTEAKAKREITITMTVAPDDKREMANVGLNVKTKLASHKGLGSTFFMGRSHGKVVIFESNPKQPGLFDPEKDKGKLEVLRRAE